MLEKKNYEVNKNISLPDSFINGQALGAVSSMRYGLFPMSYNGCEMIAICNYMRLLGKKENIAEVALEMYPKSSVLWGLFGSNPYRLKDYFSKRSMPERRITDFEKFKTEFLAAGKGIVSFWTKRVLLSSIHTVAVEGTDNGGVRVYNCFNSRPDPVEYDSFDSFIKKKARFIVGYMV